MAHTTFRAPDGLNDTPVSASNPLPVGGSAYTLFTAQASNANGSQVGPVSGGSYLFTGEGTFGGGTLKLQRLGMDGSTWFDVASASMTASGSVGVVVGQGAYLRAVLSGATGATVYANLS